MKLFGIVCLTLAVSLTTAADTVSDFATKAKVIPQSLLQKGYHRIGNLELRAFLARVDRMNLREARSVRHKQNLGIELEMERNLAEWHRTPTGDVVIASHWLKTPKEVRPLVALHESLGALGYSDEILSCSGALHILANDEAGALLGDQLGRIEEIARAECRMAGGTTGVTGGGDDFIAAGRVSSLKKSLADIRAGKDRTQAADRLGAALFVSLERNRNFKRKGSIFDPGYRTAKQCLDRSRGRADESTIKVMFEGKLIPRNPRNGWTFNEATNCIYFHGSAQHRWAGYSVLYSGKR